MPLLRLAISTFVLAGCATEKDHVLEDAGQLCATSGPNVPPRGPIDLERGQPIFLSVTAQVFGCPVEIEGQCIAHELGPSTFDVRTRIEWNEGGACAREIQYVSAQCAVLPVASEIALVHANDVLSIRIPSLVDVPCVGDIAYD
jgi:hypothetical protein